MIENIDNLLDKSNLMVDSNQSNFELDDIGMIETHDP